MSDLGSGIDSNELGSAVSSPKMSQLERHFSNGHHLKCLVNQNVVFGKYISQRNVVSPMKKIHTCLTGSAFFAKQFTPTNMQHG